jgi:hypothetical protein
MRQMALNKHLVTHDLSKKPHHWKCDELPVVKGGPR